MGEYRHVRAGKYAGQSIRVLLARVMQITSMNTYSDRLIVAKRLWRVVKVLEELILCSMRAISQTLIELA
jgi:hypothetical protein